MSTLDQAMSYLADHSGIEMTSIPASSAYSSGALYLVKDHTSHTVRGYGFINKSSDIKSGDYLFTIPAGYRPKTSVSGTGFITTSLTGQGFPYRINITSAGIITQNGTGYARGVHMVFEYEYA